MVSVRECTKRGCTYLSGHEWPPKSGRVRKVCTYNNHNRIPGNIICPRGFDEIPKEDD